MIQVPRIYTLFKKTNQIKNFGELIQSTLKRSIDSSSSFLFFLFLRSELTTTLNVLQTCSARSSR
jgi:hypothetical protein